MIKNPYVAASDLPTGFKGQSFSRLQTTSILTLVSGRMTCVALPLQAGATVTTLSLISSTTALSAGTNLWVALYDDTLAFLGQSVSDTSPTWAANAQKDFNLSSPVTVSRTGLYLAGIMSAASTPPTLVGINPSNGGSGLAGKAPSLGGNFNSSLTATAPSPAVFASAGAVPWVGYS